MTLKGWECEDGRNFKIYAVITSLTVLPYSFDLPEMGRVAKSYTDVKEALLIAYFYSSKSTIQSSNKITKVRVKMYLAKNYTFMGYFSRMQ